MILTDICEHVATLIPSTVGSVFIGDIPSLTQEGVGVKMFDGLSNTKYLGMKETVFYPTLVISLRSASYPTLTSRMSKIIQTLEGYSDSDIMGLRMVGAPDYNGRNEQKIHEFQITWQVIIKE